MNQKSPNSICIFRLSAIGDVTHMIPVIKTIQNQYPDAELTWVIGGLEHKLLQALPGVRFVVFNKSKGWSAIKQLKQDLNGQCFDVLLQMQLSFRANVVSRFIRARRRIGFDKVRSKEMHALAVNERISYVPDCHVLDGFMQFASHLGCEAKIMDWSLPQNTSDLTWAKAQLSANHANVVISPCSSHTLRNWSVERYAALVDAMVKKYGCHIILTGSPAPKEKAFVQAIEDACSEAVTNLAGQDTLPQLWSLLQTVDLVISPDSGPLHMAGAVGTPVIGLLAASNYKRSGSHQFPELTVDRYPEACQQFLKKSPEQVKWGAKTEFPGAMDLITVEAVMEKVALANELFACFDS